MGGMSNELVGWLKQQIAERGWSVREAARQAGVSPTPLNHILAGKANPGLDVYRGLAKAFDVPVAHVLRLAGEIAPPLEEQRAANPLLDEGCLLLSRLPTDDLATAVRFLRGLQLTAEEEPPLAGAEELLPLEKVEPLPQGGGGDEEVGVLRRTLANLLVSLLEHMHPDDVRAVYDHMKDVRDAVPDTEPYAARGEAPAPRHAPGHSQSG